MAIGGINSAEFVSKLEKNGNPSAFAPSAQLGQADFLLLLTTQLRNQDPSKPVDPANFVSDLTEMSQLESTNNMNTSIAAMVAGFQSLQTMQASSLIGRKVQVEGSEISHSLGQETHFKLSLDKPLSDVKVVISDSDGVVNELDIGNLSSGDELVSWDGKDSSDIQKGTGQYTITVFGIDENGGKQSINTIVPSQVNAVSIDTDGTTILTLATGEKVAMSSVREISL